MTARQNSNSGAACEDNAPCEPSRRQVRPEGLSAIGPARSHEPLPLSRHARCLQRIASNVAAETGLAFCEVVRTLETGRIDAVEQGVWGAFDRSVLRAAAEALPWLARATLGGAHKIALPAHVVPAMTDPDLVDCVIAVARRVERQQGTPAVSALQAILERGVESPGLVAWRLLALTELRGPQRSAAPWA